jgi:protein SCO1
MRSGDSAVKYTLLFTICTICLLGPIRVSAQQRAQKNAGVANERNSLSGNSIYQLNSQWTDQYDRAATLQRFQGKPLVLAMIYTSCKDACPMIVVDMQTIEEALPEKVREQVQFALISFNPEQDSPEQLRRFQSTHGLAAKHWTLLTGSENSVRMLAAVLGIHYQKLPSGEFAHSSVVTVLDSKGTIQQQQTGLKKDPGEVVSVISNLLSPTN